MRVNIATVRFTLLILILISLTALSQNGEKSIKATRIQTAPELDGNDKESVWFSILGDSSFLQIDPNPGEASAFPTIVKVAYTADALYVLFICFDPEPEKIIAREMKYDGFTSGDDNVKLILDTFGDQRNGYWFATNPLSVKNDALVAGRSYGEFNEDWDMIWDVSSAVHNNYWCAEFKLPFSSLKFPERDIQNWRINFQRGIRRLSQDVIWSGAVRNGFLFDLTRAGQLTGLQGIKRGNPVYLLPYVNGGFQDINSEKETRFKAGLDLKYGISDAFTVDLTINTDFAQVEADIAEINLTRFPLYLPEKRDFFLEGHKLFSFNLASRNLAYYSRVIGIANGEGIPIIGGLKVTGSTGNLEAGLLSVQTEGTSTKNTTNYSVGRAKFGFGTNSYAGFIFSNVQSTDRYNRMGGLDLSFNFNDFLGDQNLIITSRIAASQDNNNNKDNLAGGLSIEFPNDLVNIFSSYGFTQKNFNPESGFISEAGVNEFVFNAAWSPRFNSGMLRRLKIIPIEFRMTHDPQGSMISFEYEATPLSLTFASNDRINLTFLRQFDKPEEDFRIFKNTVIQKGEYYGNMYGFSFESNPARQLFGGFEMVYGDYYGGKRFEFENELNATLNQNFGFSLGYRFNDLDVNSTRFQTNEFFTRIKYTMNVNVASFLLFQWNNEVEELNFNYKLNIKPSPGSDIYLVINKILSTHDGLRSKDLVVILKVSWMFVI